MDRQGAAANRLHGKIEALLTADRERTAEREAAAAQAAQFESSNDEPTVHVDIDARPAPKSEPEAAHLDGEVTEAGDIVDVLASEVIAEPTFARAAVPEPEITMAMMAKTYRAADFAEFATTISPERFYEPSYDIVLRSLVGHVLSSEAPIAETLLIQRIARAHGFERAGRIIRDRVMAIVEQAHVVEHEDGGGRFVWSDADQQATWNRVRLPATPEDIRQIEDIAFAELRIAKHGRLLVDAARSLRIRRLSASAKSRIDAA